MSFQAFNPHTIRQDLYSKKKEVIKWYDENEEKETYNELKNQNAEHLDEER